MAPNRLKKYSDGKCSNSYNTAPFKSHSVTREEHEIRIANVRTSTNTNMTTSKINIVPPVELRRCRSFFQALKPETVSSV